MRRPGESPGRPRTERLSHRLLGDTEAGPPAAIIAREGSVAPTSSRSTTWHGGKDGFEQQNRMVP